MKRADRKTSDDDNAANNPAGPKREPIPYEDLKKIIATVRSQRDEAKKEIEEKTEQAEEIRRDYLEEQNKYQSTLTLYQTAETQYKSTLALYVEEQKKVHLISSKLQEVNTQAQSYLTMYDSEKVRGDELVIQLNEVQGHRDRYLTLYNESQSELKTERRSKAGVKGWETRRKKENQKLKQEISEMAMVLRDSMERKEEAINSLYSVAERMDRIQRMVDLVDDDPATNPIGMVQKLQRMWQAVKEILAE